MKTLVPLLLLSVGPLLAMDLHVSPTGDLALQDALSASRTRQAGEPCTIWLRGGRYELAGPLVLDSRDSGLVIAAHQNEKPVLSGGRRVAGWREVDGVWEAKVEDWHFRPCS